MKVLGLIVEYNPFHNGHKYHLEESKKITGADCVVCVMSSNFIQRGEPAIINKWSRAKMALLSGADLVLELPFVYSMSSAEFFANGAVKILDSLQVVDYICFGSEIGEVHKLNIIADILCSEPEKFKISLKSFLGKGLSFPAARESAIKEYFLRKEGFKVDIESIIGSSNNILGIEYLKSLKRLKSTIKPKTITRLNNAYNSQKLTGAISSATSIRKHIMENSLDKLKETLPAPSLEILEEEFSLGKGPVFSHNFQDTILSIIRKMPAEDLKQFSYVSEGLHNRIKKASKSSGSLDEIIEKTITRRYPATRIQRILFNILTGMNEYDFNQFNTYGGPQYLRILGFNQKGRELLSQAKGKATLPVVNRLIELKKSCNPLIRRMVELEEIATDLYVLGYKNPDYKSGGQEFTNNPIMI